MLMIEKFKYLRKSIEEVNKHLITNIGSVTFF
jgi:hypothetical protein